MVWSKVGSWSNQSGEGTQFKLEQNCFLSPCQVASKVVGGAPGIEILRDSGTLLDEGLHTQQTGSQWAFSLSRYEVPCTSCLLFLPGKVDGNRAQNCRLQHMLPSREGQRITSKPPLSSLLENYTAYRVFCYFNNNKTQGKKSLYALERYRPHPDMADLGA